MTRRKPDDLLSKAERACIILNKAAADVRYLVVHAVDPVRPQQVDGLADQVRASAVEHPKTQVEVELVRGGFGVEALEGAEATFRPGEETVASDGGLSPWSGLISHLRAFIVNIIGRKTLIVTPTCGEKDVPGSS